MARTSVEKQALTDPRFTVLGSHLDPLHKMEEGIVHRAVGLYMALQVWDYCSDRGLLVVHRRDLDAFHRGLAAAMIDAELVEVQPRSGGKRLRIKGGSGRLDWSVRARSNGDLGKEHGKKGAEFGKLGGRPKKDETPHPGVSKTPLRGDTKTPPLTQALTLTQAQEDKSFARSAAPTRAARSTGLPGFDRFWEAYPPRNGSKAGKAQARKLWLAKKLETRADELVSAIQRQRDHAEACDRIGKFRPEFADAVRWIRNERWTDEFGDVPPPKPEVTGDPWRTSTDPTLQLERLEQYAADRQWLDDRTEHYQAEGLEYHEARAKAVQEFNAKRRSGASGDLAP
jgi:hypothetical protein